MLTSEDPVHYERTSGSGALRKDIPYTGALMREFQSALVVWLATLVRDCPAVAGPSYWSLSPDPSPTEATASGIKIGSASDAVYLTGCPAERLLPTVVGSAALWEAVAPGSRNSGAAADGRSGDDWQLETVRMLAAAPDLRMLSVWSPTFLLSLLDVVLDRARAPSSIDKLRRGLPKDRYRCLRAALEQRNFAKLWPNLGVISCWADGPSAVFSAALAPMFPGTRIVPKGLFATEGVVSFSWGTGSERPVAITSHFLEFVDDDDNARTVDELDIGACYRPLLTTSGGLYRYRLGDVVAVTGFIGKTPCIRFVGREDSRSDLVGEKLDEPIVSGALRAAGLAGPAILVPVADARPARYVLITETPGNRHENQQDDRHGNSDDGSDDARCGDWPRAVETELCRAHHYSIARRNGQLAAVSSARTDNLSALLHTAWQTSGRRSGDAKPSSLIASRDFAAAIIAALRAGAPGTGRG